jgi:hypothetical protein
MQGSSTGKKMKRTVMLFVLSARAAACGTSSSITGPSAAMSRCTDWHGVGLVDNHRYEIGSTALCLKRE